MKTAEIIAVGNIISYGISWHEMRLNGLLESMSNKFDYLFPPYIDGIRGTYDTLYSKDNVLRSISAEFKFEMAFKRVADSAL